MLSGENIAANAALSLRSVRNAILKLTVAWGDEKVMGEGC
jgi:hypothetical protein